MTVRNRPTRRGTLVFGKIESLKFSLAVAKALPRFSKQCSVYPIYTTQPLPTPQPMEAGLMTSSIPY